MKFLNLYQIKLKFLNFYGDGVSDEILIIININILNVLATTLKICKNTNIC